MAGSARNRILPVEIRCAKAGIPSPQGLLHNSLNRNRFLNKIMQQFRVLQRVLRRSKRGAAL
ncbi:hypothetical protein E0H38_19320 [Rhizobium leguminosarum bv. viciae]|nr:hypothetical protein E0H38_19320 [Rhizobium leguminosarum bv. viciae]